MGEVIPLPRPCVVEVCGGVVTSVVLHDERGRKRMDVPAGVQRFFVDVVDVDGTRIGLWDGGTYDQAIKEALAIQRDWAPARLVDLVGGAA